jgi:hypothetical protein
MHKKIKDYVWFKLRNDHSSDHLEKKEEISSNIMERYDELFEQSNDEENAYVEAIKTIGEFVEEDVEQVAYKPEFAEMLLVSATVLSIISLLATLLSAVAGIIIVGTSITLYAVGAVYLYQYSKFTANEEYDIQKYQTFLNKTFSYMKTNFIFWSLSLSLIISQLIYSIVLVIATISTINNMSIEDFFGVYFFSILGFFIVLAIIGSMFISLYRKLMKKYTDLTGDDDVQSVGMKARIFLGKRSERKTNWFLNKWFYSAINIIVIIFLILDIIGTSSFYNDDYNNLVNLVLVLNSSFIVFYGVVTALYLLGKIKRRLLVPFFNVLSSVTMFLIWIVVNDIARTGSFAGPFFFIAGIVFIILLIIDYSMNRTLK